MRSQLLKFQESKKRSFPHALAGERYKNDIPIHPESQLEQVIEKYDADEVAFAYSDVSHEYVMHIAARALKKGASFQLLGPKFSMIESKLPVISVCAVRTGCGKSQTSRKIVKVLKKYGKRVGVIRHPMPYGDLVKQKAQRFEKYQDLLDHKCTIEEIEEYEPHLEMGAIVYAGVDYKEIARIAESENDILLWDGGNNDWSFYKPTIEVVVTDPLRAGDEMRYYPGEVNLRRADVIVINKIGSAPAENVFQIRDNVAAVNENALIIEAASPLYVENASSIKGKRVLVIEDGPTLTHGNMRFGAGFMAARKYGAKEIVDPRPYAIGSLKETFAKYTHLESILPAMGYGDGQIHDLKATIDAIPCDLVIIGTPINLGRLVHFQKPSLRVRYELQEIGDIDIEYALKAKEIIS